MLKDTVISFVYNGGSNPGERRMGFVYEEDSERVYLLDFVRRERRTFLRELMDGHTKHRSTFYKISSPYTPNKAEYNPIANTWTFYDITPGIAIVISINHSDVYAAPNTFQLRMKNHRLEINTLDGTIVAHYDNGEVISTKYNSAKEIADFIASYSSC